MRSSHLFEFKDHFVYAPSQWEMALLCNAISHWLGTYTVIPVNLLWFGTKVNFYPYPLGLFHWQQINMEEYG